MVQQEIIEALEKGGLLTSKELSELLNINRSNITEGAKKLEHQQEIKIITVKFKSESWIENYYIKYELYKNICEFKG